jgi:hypothetical protein
MNRPATVNRELATLSHLLNKAVEWGWIERPPAKVRKLKEDNARIVYLTAAQAESLLEAAKTDQNRQIYLFILIGLRNREHGCGGFGARNHASYAAFPAAPCEIARRASSGLLWTRLALAGGHAGLWRGPLGAVFPHWWRHHESIRTRGAFGRALANSGGLRAGDRIVALGGPLAARTGKGTSL